MTTLARRLNAFDATMLVMGGIIGSGIFINPCVVARQVHTPALRVPVVAIVLQGVVAIVIALSGTYEQILNYVVSVDFIFFGLTGLSLFVFRKRMPSAGFRTPLHPYSTAIFVAACWLVVIGTFVKEPKNSLIGLLILAAGIPFGLRRARLRTEDR